MTTASVRWLFICSKGGLWTWRSADSFAVATFTDLDAATADATLHGFDPFTHYWTANSGGRTTHFRPGKDPLNLPSTEDPPL